MPSEDEILETKLWTLAKYLRELPVEFRYHSGDGVEYAIKEVIDLSAELHKSVIVVLEQTPYVSQTTPVEKESGEGDVLGSGRDRLTGPEPVAAGSAAADSGGPEEVRGRPIRGASDGSTGAAQVDRESSARQGAARLKLSEIRDMVDKLAYDIDRGALTNQQVGLELGKIHGHVEILDDILSTMAFDLEYYKSRVARGGQ